ncbi:MAG: amidohydrolase family protein [Gammaproteobacteria bacterium]|nr:amidohydrolase family protein [Gammaproteobacteria bacterium]
MASTFTRSVAKQVLSSLLTCGVVFLTACSQSEPPAKTQSETAAPVPSVAASTATVFQGARLIPGDRSAPIDDGVLVIDQGRIIAVGDSTVAIPAGATVIDVRGMTIMPAIVDTHTHLNGERAALEEDLRARARFGISAALSLGLDASGEVFAVRAEEIPGAARYRTAGRGITSPEPGRSEVPHWITNEEEARAAVRDEAARQVDIIKIWVDDRDGAYQKLSPDLYRAVIDEAHANGLRVAAHIFNQSDAKGLLDAGIDAFAHGVRDIDIDDEMVAMFNAHPEVVLIPNLPGRGVPADFEWLRGRIPDDQVERLATAGDNPKAQAAFGIQARNLKRLYEAGVTIALGTDGNTAWAPHTEMEDMVISGMQPADVIIAATSNAATFLKLDDTGTLAVGKRADFIVLDADPLQDITNTRRIHDVYLQGERIER